MKDNKRFIHLFYGLTPLLVYYGVTMFVVLIGANYKWETDILNFVNGLLNLVVLYFVCYRTYNRRGGSREIPPLFPWIQKQKTDTDSSVQIPESKDAPAEHRESRISPRKMWRMEGRAYIWIAVLGACASIALNNWFSIMGLFQKIETYDKVAQSIYYGSLWMIFARTAVLAPLVEEILVRGLVYRSLSHVMGRFFGMICSALIFALMHGNLLQGMYAFLLGILFSYVYDMSGRNIFAPVLAHFTANLISVLGTSVGLVKGLFSEYFFILTGLTTILLIISVVEISHAKKSSL